MTIRFFWMLRFSGFALVGILALINPPHSAAQRAVQIAAFAAVGAALLAWRARRRNSRATGAWGCRSRSA